MGLPLFAAVTVGAPNVVRDEAVFVAAHHADHRERQIRRDANMDFSWVSAYVRCQEQTPRKKGGVLALPVDLGGLTPIGHLIGQSLGRKQFADYTSEDEPHMLARNGDD